MGTELLHPATFLMKSRPINSFVSVASRVLLELLGGIFDERFKKKNVDKNLKKR